MEKKEITGISIQVIDAKGKLISQPVVRILLDGKDISRQLIISRQPGLVSFTGLEPGVKITVLVKAARMVEQRREVQTLTGGSTQLFIMAPKGTSTFTVGGVKVPYQKDEYSLYFVQTEQSILPGEKSKARRKKVLDLLGDKSVKRVERTMEGLMPVEPFVKGKSKKKATRSKRKNDLPESVHTQLEFALRLGPKNKEYKKFLAKARKEKLIGRPALSIEMRKDTAGFFAGEISVVFAPEWKMSRLKPFCAKYNLKVISQEGNHFIFDSLDLDYGFESLCEKIRTENKDVLLCEPIVYAQEVTTVRRVPGDFLYLEQWDFEIEKLPEAWFHLQRQLGAAREFGDSNVIICVTDLHGVEGTHPAFTANVGGQAKLFAQYDFQNNVVNNVTNLLGPHGTDCAGAALANVDGNGTVGTAPGARLVGVRASSPSSVANPQKYNWLNGFTPVNPAQLSRPVDIDTNSFNHGAAVISQAEMEMLERATDFGRTGRGLLPFYSAGNDFGAVAGNSRLAAYTRTLCVASSSLLNSGTLEAQAPYSNFGMEVDFCAHSSSNAAGVQHNPPTSYGALVPTATPATVTARGFVGEGNMPSNMGNVGGVNLTDTLAPPGIAGGVSTSATLTNPVGNYTINDALFIDAVGTVNAESARIVAPAPAGNLINLRPDAVSATMYKPHLPAVNVIGGPADYTHQFGGTSYSTPFCAGIAGLMLSLKPTLSWVEVREIMRTSTRKINVGEAGLGGAWFDAAPIGAPGRPVGAPAVPTSVLNAGAVVPKPGGVGSTTLRVGFPANMLVDVIASRNRKSSVLTVVSSAGFEIGDALQITGGGNNDFHIVENVDHGANTITIDALRHNFLVAGTVITAGAVKPVFSGFYGYGRITADLAVKNTTDYNHNQRDLVIRNNLNDTGLNQILDIVASPIHSPDIWIQNAGSDEPVTTIPPYNQLPNHQNPSNTVNRFIYARIKNIGNQYSNLDAWVHFYVALTDETVPPQVPNINPAPGVVTPFIFPGDPTNANATLVQKSWCDIPANDIVSVTGITTGIQNVYHVKDNVNPALIPLQYNILIPAGTIRASDAADINAGTFVTRVQWNQAAIPPAATTLKTYLLVYVSPVDGANQGNRAGLNNNMSFREVAFAEFHLFDNGGVNPLPSSHTVDEFGTPLVTQFRFRVSQTIGRFQTDRVVLEFTRTNDNGTTEKAFFRKNGASWQVVDALNAPGVITWVHVTAPVKTAGGAPGVNETDITFSGDFATATQHHKISVKGIIHSTRAGANLVPIAEQVFDIMVNSNVPQTPSASGSNQLPPRPESHVFTDFATLVQPQPANKSFGPVDSGHFRITSTFTSSAAHQKAYAVANGVVMVQPVDADRVTLVIRPLRQPGLSITPVKYYVYRGLKRSDFFNAANTEVRASAGASDFIQRLHTLHAAQNPPATAFLATALGHDPAHQAAGDLIDSYFFREGNNIQMALCRAGEWLGDFHNTGGSEFGFEIVMEEGTSQPKYSYLRQNEFTIDVSALPETNDTERLTKRIARDEVLNYIDPAAFYGMHFAGSLKRPAGAAAWTGQDIVTNVVNKFATKEKVYVDIRNENGNSYNFYQNYKGPTGAADAGQNIKHGVLTTAFTSGTYQTQDWPLLILSLTANSATAENPLHLQLRWDDNLKPILYAEHGKITSNNFGGKFVDETRLFTGVPVTQQWTNTVSLASPNKGSAPNKKSIAWIFKLIYGRQIDATTTWPTTVVKTTKTLDNLFGPVDTEPLWNTAARVRWIAAQDKKYVDGQALGFGQIMERGNAFEGNSTTGRMVFYAAAMDLFRFQGAGYQPRRGITGGTSDGVSYLQAAGNMDQYRLEFGTLTDGATKVTTLTLLPGAVNAGVPAAMSSMLFLGITHTEYDRLKALAGLNNAYPRTVFFEELPAYNPNYKKYKLGVQGQKTDGTWDKVMPTAGNEVFVYSTNQFTYFSDGFSADEPVPTTYTRNYEENIGTMPLQFHGGGTYAIVAATTGAGGTFAVAGDITQLICRGATIRVSGATTNDGSYTISTVAFNSGLNRTVLTVAGSVTNATAAGNVNLDNRAIEDHFIHMDPAGAVAGAPNELKQILATFEAALTAIPNTPAAEAAIAALIDIHGVAILTRARAVAALNTFANADDRPLYWTRIKMQVLMKSQEFLLQNFEARDRLVKQLEQRSRGIGSTPLFSGAGANKKMLVIGFDPFQMNSTLGENSHQSNPSGCAALVLHNKRIQSKSGTITGHIETVIMPVRFRDFNDGMIDQFIDQYLHGANMADVIISMNQDVDSRFRVERFAGKTRVMNIADNEGITGLAPVYYELSGGALNKMTTSNSLSHFLQSTLTVSALVPGTTYAAADVQPFLPVAPGSPFVARCFAAPGRDTRLDQTWEDNTGRHGAETITGALQANAPANNAVSVQGSAGSHVANEIFYRIALRRQQRNTTLKTGHLSVPRLQLGAADRFSPSATKTYLAQLIQILVDAAGTL